MVWVGNLRSIMVWILKYINVDYLFIGSFLFDMFFIFDLEMWVIVYIVYLKVFLGDLSYIEYRG